MPPPWTYRTQLLSIYTEQGLRKKKTEPSTYLVPNFATSINPPCLATTDLHRARFDPVAEERERYEIVTKEK